MSRSHIGKRQVSRIRQLKIMGFALLGLATSCLTAALVLRGALNAEFPSTWQSVVVDILGNDIMGLFAMAGLFLLMSFFCLGSVWQSRMFLR